MKPQIILKMCINTFNKTPSSAGFIFVFNGAFCLPVGASGMLVAAPRPLLSADALPPPPPPPGFPLPRS